MPGELHTIAGCELLQKVYLCSSKHNYVEGFVEVGGVVNCFKKCIFAVASTITFRYVVVVNWL